MSLTRSITIKLLTNHSCLSKFMKDFSENVWTIKNLNGTYVSTPLHDYGNFDYQAFESLKEVFSILDEKEKLKKMSAVIVWDKEMEECFGFYINILESEDNSQKNYELNFGFDADKRLKNSERHTDFSHYLNYLLPKLEKMGCVFYEINCSDYGF